LGADVEFLGSIWRFLTDGVQWVINVVKQVFTDVWTAFTDAVKWVVVSLLDVVKSLVEALPAPEWSYGWSGLPGELLNILGLIGLDYCLGIIGTALLIRLSMQLIPFVRLGS